MTCTMNGSLPRGPETISKYLTLAVNGCVYAIKIPFVQKIAQISSISPLPHMAPHILGVTQADGKVYTVVDLRILFGEGLETAPLPSAAILLIYQGAQICAVVDNVLSVTDINTETAAHPPAGASWVSGVIHGGAESIHLLSMNCLFCDHQENIWTAL